MLRADFASFLLGLGTAVAEASPRVDAMSGRLRQLEAVRGTSAVHGDADDCAIWIHPTDPERSLVLGTDKARDQGIHVWDLQGRRLQFVRVERPNNIDVRQGVRLGGAGAPIDIAVATVRGARGLRVYRIDRERAGGPLVDITVEGGIPTPELDDPYGLCLYVRRGADGAVFAFASTAAGDRGRVHQYRLEAAAGGRVRARHVRALGQGAIRDKVEGLVADDVLGLVYAADERYAVHEFAADPDSGAAPRTIFAREGIEGDREGLGLYRCDSGLTYLLLSSQANHALKVFRREDAARGTSRFTLVATYITPKARQTDGLEVTSQALGSEFPSGVLLKHDAPRRRFMFYAWPPEPRVGCQEPEGGWPDQFIR